MYFQRLRDLREDKDLRQEDVAEILGISQTVYSRYQVSTDYILGRTNTSKPYPVK